MVMRELPATCCIGLRNLAISVQWRVVAQGQAAAMAFQETALLYRNFDVSMTLE